MTCAFPKNLSIQTTASCNARCVFCPHKDVKGDFPPALMSDALFEKMIDECSRHHEIERLILYLNNEPLTDPKICERINLAKERVPWACVHILTNGSLLTEETARRLAASKADWVGISFHGIRKETIENAMGLDFELTRRRVLDFISIASEKHDISNYVMLTFLKHPLMGEGEMDEAKRFWQAQGITRISAYDGPLSRAGNVAGMDAPRHRAIAGCESIWANEMMHIVENGDVVLCCMDWRREVVLGNAWEQGLEEIWNSSRYNVVRAMRDGLTPAEKNFLCTRCEAAVPAAGDAWVSRPEGAVPDVVLVTLPPWGVENPPLGLGFLESYLVRQGLRPSVLDLNIAFYNAAAPALRMLWHVENKNYWSAEKTFRQLLPLFDAQLDRAAGRIAASGAPFAAFSVVDPKERITAELISRVKKLVPGIKVVLGGAACSTDTQRELFMRLVPGMVDYFVVGEGEETLFEILRRHKEGVDTDAIPGTAVKDGAGWQLVPREPLKPLDRAGFPMYNGFSCARYLSTTGTFLVQWSRGCIGRCSFCKNFTLEPGFRSRSAESIIAELAFLIERYGVREVTVADNVMNGDLKLLEEVCRGIIGKGLNVRWSGQIAPRQDMDAKLFSLMAGAGCFKVQIGVESGSARVLKAMRKTYLPETSEKVLRLAAGAGLETEIFIITGFPGETERDHRATEKFIRRNESYISAVKSINTLHLIAGTEICEKPADFGLKPLPEKDWHYLWEAGDGNTYAVRKKRAWRLLALCDRLGLRVMETNIQEGKEQAEPAAGEGLEVLQRRVNLLQSLPSGRPRAGRRVPFRMLLLFFTAVFTLASVTYFWLFRKLRGRPLMGWH